MESSGGNPDQNYEKRLWVRVIVDQIIRPQPHAHTAHPHPHPRRRWHTLSYAFW